MSKGPGRIEQRIADLFAATRDRALSISEIADNAYELGGRTPTRAQRLSATRAAHRLLRRVREADARMDDLRDRAHANTAAARGREEHRGYDKALNARLEQDPAWREMCRLFDWCYRIG